MQVSKHMPSSAVSDEPSDLEELEKFAKTFKQRRIKLGFTQVRGKRQSHDEWFNSEIHKVGGIGYGCGHGEEGQGWVQMWV